MARKALIQLRRDTAANWTSVNPTLAAGEIGFETDTSRFKIGTGSAAWTALNYSSSGVSVGATPPSTPTNGSPWFNTNDGTLYIYYTDANSSQWVQIKANSALQSSILSRLGALESQAIAFGYLSPNYIINGAFDFNQRAFTSATTNASWGFDRWRLETDGTGATYSSQSFTPGTAPLAAVEGTSFARLVTTGQSITGTYTILRQPIEDVHTLTGQTVTVSFWAKSASGTPKIAVEFYQNFGTGGSSAVSTPFGAITLTGGTAWTRYSVTGTVPTILGKTFGAGNCLELLLWVSGGSTFATRNSSIGIQSNTFDVWGVQVEQGSVATGFRRNANSLQGELAACQRYYQTGRISYDQGYVPVNSACGMNVVFPVPMRATPTDTYSFSGSNSRQGANRFLTNTSLGRYCLSNSTAALTAYEDYTMTAEL
jgi:hypothetical protein